MLAVPSLDAARPDAGRRPRTAALLDVLRERILVLDGAMGTMLQGYAPRARPTSAARASPTTRATCAAPTTCWR